MYPIMSPSILSVQIEIYDGKSIYSSENQIIKSPSNNLLEFDIDELVANSNFKNVTMFKLIASASNGNIPTRVPTTDDRIRLNFDRIAILKASVMRTDFTFSSTFRCLSGVATKSIKTGMQ